MAKKYVMIKHTSPRATFRRAHLQFTKDWQVFEVGEQNDSDPNQPGSTEITEDARARHARGVIGPDTLRRCEAETMLAVKPATADDVQNFQKTLASRAGKSTDQIIAELAAKNAELEARLMKVELGKGGSAAAGGGGK